MTARTLEFAQPRSKTAAQAPSRFWATATEWPTSRDWRVAALLLVLTAIWGFAATLTRGRIFHQTMYEQELIAEHLALGHGFASPLDRSADAPPSSYSPPAWPMLASLVYRALGINSPASQLVLAILNAAFFSVMCAAVYLITSLLFFRIAGLFAVGLILIHKPMLDALPGIWSHMMGLMLFACIILGSILVRRSRANSLKLFGLGALMGILSLTSPPHALAYPLLVIYAIGRVSWGRVVQLSATALVGFVLVLLPWTIRNYSVFGKLFYVRDTLNLELWHGNLPVSAGIQDKHTYPLHPFNDAHERALMLELGEREYFELCGRRFAQMYCEDPAGFWRRTLNRAVILAYGDTTTRFGGGRFERFKWKHHYLDRLLFNTFFTTLGLAGIWAIWRKKWDGLWLIAAGVLAVLPYLPTHAADRYALPLRLVLIMAGGVALGAAMLRLLPHKPAPGAALRQRSEAAAVDDP